MLLAEYQPYWAARAELLMRAGETTASEQAYLRAIGLEADPSVRAFLQRRIHGRPGGGVTKKVLNRK